MRIDFDNIEIMHPDAGGGSVYYYQGKPFTGTIVEFKDGVLVGEITVVDSHTKGRVASYFANGKLEEEYFESYNRMYGVYRRWDEKGNLVSEHDYGEEYKPYGHELLLAVDVHYRDNTAKVVGVLFNWHDEKPREIFTEYVEGVEDYIPGEFYKRELPCIMKLLSKIDLNTVTAIVIDGYIFIDNYGKYGLGGMLFESLDRKIPIIGVAKTWFEGNGKTVRDVLRGESKNPLFISAVEYPLEIAKKNIADMKGNYRIPKILQELDKMTKEP